MVRSDPHVNAWRAFLGAYSTATEQVERALAEADLPPMAWYDVVWAVYKSPGRSLRQFELADAMVMSRSGLSRLLDRIEAAGLIERKRCSSDRRGADVVVTDAGAAMLRRVWPVYRRAIDAHFARYVGDDAPTIIRALERVESAAEPAATST